MTDYKELRKLAKAATKGPWEYDGKFTVTINFPDGTLTAFRTMKPDAAYIAAADPQTAIGLLDRLEAAKAKVSELQDFAIWMAGCGYDFCQHKHFCEQRDRLLR